MVVKVDTTSDIRRYCSPHRDTKRWKELYNERTSVERCNSRMKTYLTADSMHIWGFQKVTTHQYLNAIILLATALAMAQHSSKAAA
jgi:transposase, IS5 family